MPPGKFALLTLILEALLSKHYKVVKLILDGYPPHWTTPCAWSRGCGGCKFLKGILFLFYKSTEMTT